MKEAIMNENPAQTTEGENKVKPAEVYKSRRDNRLFKCTATWTENGERFRRTIMLCAENKNIAEGMATNHLPRKITDNPSSKDLNIRISDLGVPKAGMTYFVEEIARTTRSDPNKISPIEQALSQFSIIWGNEIGWRACTEYQNETDRAQLEKMNAIPNIEQILYDWAKEFSDFDSDDMPTFFCEKFSTLISANITSVAELKPRVQNDYQARIKAEREQIINNARAEAKRIIENANIEKNAILKTTKDEADAIKANAVEEAHGLNERANAAVTERLTQMNEYIQAAQNAWENEGQSRRSRRMNRQNGSNSSIITDKIVNGQKRRVFDIGNNMSESSKALESAKPAETDAVFSHIEMNLEQDTTPAADSAPALVPETHTASNETRMKTIDDPMTYQPRHSRRARRENREKHENTVKSAVEIVHEAAEKASDTKPIQVPEPTKPDEAAHETEQPDVKDAFVAGEAETENPVVNVTNNDTPEEHPKEVIQTIQEPTEAPESPSEPTNEQREPSDEKVSEAPQEPSKDDHVDTNTNTPADTHTKDRTEEPESNDREDKQLRKLKKLAAMDIDAITAESIHDKITVKRISAKLDTTVIPYNGKPAWETFRETCRMYHKDINEVIKTSKSMAVILNKIVMNPEHGTKNLAQDLAEEIIQEEKQKIIEARNTLKRMGESW